MGFTSHDGGSEPLEQELEEARAAQEALLAALPDLMFRIRRDGTYLEFAGDLSRLATPADELVGSNIHEILPPEVARALMGCAQGALRAGSCGSSSTSCARWPESRARSRPASFRPAPTKS